MNRHLEKVHEIGKMRRQKMFSLIWLKSVYVLQTVLTSSGELFAFIECIQTVKKCDLNTRFTRKCAKSFEFWRTFCQ